MATADEMETKDIAVEMASELCLKPSEGSLQIIGCSFCAEMERVQYMQGQQGHGGIYR